MNALKMWIHLEKICDRNVNSKVPAHFLKKAKQEYIARKM